jgi:hypothetical protein
VCSSPPSDTQTGDSSPKQYAAFRLDDGVSFLHVAVLDGGDNPLLASAAFAEFQSGIKDRCIDGPAPADATVIGSYRSRTD